MSNISKSKSKPKFKVGDKVAEKSRYGKQAKFNPYSDDVAKKFRDRTLGIVQEVFTKTARGGANYFYVKVAWINSNHVSIHSQMRLESVED
tara:strand:- start:2336 stop:2608 length:273 start_codon:yes stop_codon:yes gene_type:complete